ncbi:helix-turn-helix domain-containing protein [Aquimarina sp. MMG015]|uniref:helix-turn-helix domain-containing protein n=1 Tax=unclassified Aquimarina TaxID=2627091 RepID=UPI000E4A95F3|nr:MULTISPECIES: helix-turn-helix domain-containing protein [unclassified Aquimarina]AXT56218.1 DNA-binding protein [Aquimarina sp. AD1]MBQ4803683.1 helix-turn-helix domain-containing protein [Aquimarina sp. MMG015]RKN34216.1 helix-turn-helix domain-containing protein [Aquimarina sp. AD1]
MNNPFEILNERLANIESLLLDIKHKPVEEQKPENLTVKETAELLKVSEQSVHNYIKRGTLPAQKVGRILIIKREDLDNALTEVKSLKYKRA